MPIELPFQLSYISQIKNRKQKHENRHSVLGYPYYGIARATFTWPTGWTHAQDVSMWPC